jgi:glycerol-1-phosphate dehydrogenase [NAD(P)+]
MHTHTHIVTNITFNEIELILQSLEGATRLLAVMDEHTKAAMGEQLHSALKHNKNVTLLTCYCFEAEVTPHLHQCDHLQTLCRSHQIQAIIAVGSGTINDICKYAAYQLDIPYVICATAPSMNGYMSGNASIITQDGFKTTLKARPPVVVICDMSVITAAPIRLIQAGFGDAICRSTAQVDWLFSHHLLGTPYDDAPFALTRKDEPELIASAPQLYARDMHAITLLMQNLLDSGRGMHIAGGSYPASQGEHMLAHTMEMAYHHHPELTPATSHFHGEEIAVTTLYMAQLHTQILSKDTAPQLQNLIPPISALTQLLGEKIATNCLNDYTKKQALIGDLTTLQNKLNHDWHEIRYALRTIHIPPHAIAAALHHIHAATTPEALGWNAELWHAATSLARFTRDRFTMLDVTTQSS